MASETREVKPIHFFKIILTQNLHEGKLMIPRKFVEKYGEGLSKSIYLKTTNGAKWKLDLVKSDDGKIWFEKGWKEFAEYHSLAHGHLLLFKYQRNSHFLVCIFENSGLEINYPFQRVAAEKVSKDQRNKPTNGENCRAAQKRKANFSFEFHQPCEIESSSCVKVGKLQKVATMQHTDRKSKGKQVITANKVTTLERAKSFKTCNPSFVVVMRAACVEPKCALTIPRMFGKTHFDLDKKRGDIYFQVLNGKVWPARYSIRMFTHGPRFELTRGWKEFAMDNNLKVGDVCKFELISCTSTILAFHVHIFRETNNDNTNCSTSQISFQMKEEATQG